MTRLLTGTGLILAALSLTACKEPSPPPKDSGTPVDKGPRTENPAGVPLPSNYATTYTNYLNLDRVQAKEQVIRLYANDAAMKGPGADGKLPYGSVLVAEVYKAKKDADGKVVSALGRRVQGDMAAIVVMQREKGFGKDYPEELRNGEWDYAAYKPDGSGAGKNLNKCLECHAPEKDKNFVFSIEHLKGPKSSIKSPLPTLPAVGPDQPVSLSSEYKKTFTNYLSLDRTQNEEQVIELYANDTAMQGPGADGKLPYGSVLVAEVYKAKKGPDGKVVSALGRRVRGVPAVIVAMQREKGFGKDAPADIRNGEWAYAAFKTDGSVAKKDLNKCLECHVPLKDKNFVFSFDHLKK